jgi:hypothetical protein
MSDRVCAKGLAMGALALLGFAAFSACDPGPGPAPMTAEQCIRDTGTIATAPGGAREYNCAGFEERFLLAIPPACVSGGCGLIADLPGATAPAENPNLNTGLRQMARSLAQPYIVLGADRPPTQFFNAGSPDRIFRFMQAVANVFNVDRSRIHIGGFSNGGSVTFDFICDPQKAAFIASAAPQASARSIGGAAVCARPLVPVLFFTGRNDNVAGFANMQAVANRFAAGIGAGAAMVIDSSPLGNFVQRRFIGANGLVFEQIAYDNIKDPRLGPPDLGGHCYAGAFSPNPGACTDPAGFNNGMKTLQFYLENPKAP